MSWAQSGYSETNEWSAGFLAHEFPLTLAPGHRFEAAGPFFFREDKETQQQVGIPPFFSRTLDPHFESEEIDFLYPVLTYDRFGREYRWQIGQLFSFAGGQTQVDDTKKRFTLFPVYFQQRSGNPDDNYTALFPFYGTYKKRLMRDATHFVAFPLYSQTRKKDVVTSNYLYPIFHRRTGTGLEGWQVFPLFGTESKTLTWTTNNLNEAVAVGGHEKKFYLWPFFVDRWSELGTTNITHEQLFMPFYLVVRSPDVDSTTYGWPIGLTRLENKTRHYHETGAPWPIVVFRRGESNVINRVWPLFSFNQAPGTRRDRVLVPLFQRESYATELVERERTRILFFLYSDTSEKHVVEGSVRRRTDLMPLFSAQRDFDGRTRLQILAILDPLFPNNKSIERDYAPIYSFWRSEDNPKTGVASQSFLWNFYRNETAPGSRKCSLLFGLFQYQSNPREKRWRLFYIPFGSGRSSTEKQPVHP